EAPLPRKARLWDPEPDVPQDARRDPWDLMSRGQPAATRRAASPVQQRRAASPARQRRRQATPSRSPPRTRSSPTHQPSSIDALAAAFAEAFRIQSQTTEKFVARQTQESRLPSFSGDPLEWPLFAHHYG